MSLAEYAYPNFTRKMFLREMAIRGGPKPGEPMPDFSLPTTEGEIVTKSDFVGKKPLVLSCGSVTCPMTASGTRVLKKLYDKYGDRVAFVTLYVREAQPGGCFPQPDTSDQKLANAKFFKERERISWPVAVDNLSGDFHQLLGSNASAVYIMDTDGNVAFKTLWSGDESGIRKALDAVLSHAILPLRQRQPHVLPMLAGVGLAYDLLDSVGGTSKRNWIHAVPPIFVLARTASVFRPLPPFWRGVAALAVTATGVAAAVAGLRALFRRRRLTYS